MKIGGIFIIILLIFNLLCAASPRAQNADSAAVRKSSPRGALIRSALVPGLGQFYNKKYIKAGVFTVGESYLIYNIATDWKAASRHKKNFQSSSDPVYQAQEFAEYEKYRDRKNLNLWITAAVVFYSMFDAYVDAHLSDFNQPDKAFEAYLEPMPDNGIRLMVELNFR